MKRAASQKPRSSPEDACAKFSEARALSCREAVELARSLAASSAKAVECVTLTPSQYPSCSNIVVTLVDALAAKLVAPLVMVKGDFKLYQNKKSDMQRQGNDSGFFVRIKPVCASQLLYQMMEAIYSNIKSGVRCPPSLRTFNVDTGVDNTFKSGYLYVNRISGALVEYTGEDGRSAVSSMAREMDSLVTRDAQMATVILSPVVFYRSGCEAKITFALKKVSLPRECSLTVLGLDGESTTVGMSETGAVFGEEQEVRGLGVVAAAEGAAATFDAGDDGEEDNPFNI